MLIRLLFNYHTLKMRYIHLGLYMWTDCGHPAGTWECPCPVRVCNFFGPQQMLPKCIVCTARNESSICIKSYSAQFCVRFSSLWLDYQFKWSGKLNSSFEMLRSQGIVGGSVTSKSVHDKEKEKSGLRHMPSVLFAFMFGLWKTFLLYHIIY